MCELKRGEGTRKSFSTPKQTKREKEKEKERLLKKLVEGNPWRVDYKDITMYEAGASGIDETTKSNFFFSTQQ